MTLIRLPYGQFSLNNTYLRGHEREEKEQEKDLADHGGGFHAGQPAGSEDGGDSGAWASGVFP